MIDPFSIFLPNETFIGDASGLIVISYCSPNTWLLQFEGISQLPSFNCFSVPYSHYRRIPFIHLPAQHPSVI